MAGSLTKVQIAQELPKLSGIQFPEFFENTDGYVLSMLSYGEGSEFTVPEILSSLNNLNYVDYVWVENNIDKSKATIAAQRDGNRPCPTV